MEPARTGSGVERKGTHGWQGGEVRPHGRRGGEEGHARVDRWRGDRPLCLNRGFSRIRGLRGLPHTTLPLLSPFPRLCPSHAPLSVGTGPRTCLFRKPYPPAPLFASLIVGYACTKKNRKDRVNAHGGWAERKGTHGWQGGAVRPHRRRGDGTGTHGRMGGEEGHARVVGWRGEAARAEGGRAGHARVDRWCGRARTGGGVEAGIFVSNWLNLNRGYSHSSKVIPWLP